MKEWEDSSNDVQELQLKEAPSVTAKVGEIKPPGTLKLSDKVSGSNKVVADLQANVGAGNNQTSNCAPPNDSNNPIDIDGQVTVRYEYFDRRSDRPRDPRLELQVLLYEILQANNEATLLLLNSGQATLRDMDDLPCSDEGMGRFFKREIVEGTNGRKHVYAFTICSEHDLQTLKEYNSKRLQKYLQFRKTSIREHKFETLVTEQVGWFACRIAGISFEKLELELMVELDKTVPPGVRRNYPGSSI
jgi:hypothetical protein